jgi:hypothetical protein
MVNGIDASAHVPAATLEARIRAALTATVAASARARIPSRAERIERSL